MTACLLNAASFRSYLPLKRIPILIIKEILCGFLLFIYEPKTAINEIADAVAQRRCPTPETGKSQFSPSPAFTVIY